QAVPSDGPIRARRACTARRVGSADRCARRVSQQLLKATTEGRHVEVMPMRLGGCAVPLIDLVASPGRPALDRLELPPDELVGERGEVKPFGEGTAVGPL